MTGGWWRRNAVPLGVIAVLLPVTVGVIAMNEWFEFDLGNAPAPITAQPGEAISYAGAGIGPVSAELDDDPAAPSGTRVLSARVLIAPDDPITCLTPTLHELSGAHREWTEDSFDLDREFDPDIHTSCDPELGIRYSLSLEYIVPDDATGPFALELRSTAGGARFAQLVIEP